ncbi:hypothetical protein RE628_13755 [Paenibacillus sp. D2_2]|uniref:hypothetical protein n=1 Tax=Paenibacillus sp. D2_2 TaxID=3073092 RepID=UPI0028150388|nr:hypothetical protein [Paenibacillus sp. D2_2]WMT43218.1 hypothetical protein RE628_13755 [Paenibacillus sp. D2_2]
MQNKLTSKESTLIIQSVQDYLLKLRSENEDSLDKEFLNNQITTAQSVFEKVLGLKLSDDGKSISDMESPDGILLFKANYKYNGRDKKTRMGSMVVQVLRKDSVKQAIIDRLHKERGWEKGWIFVDTIQQVESIEDTK